MSNSDSTVHIQPHPATSNQPDAGHDATSGAIHAPPGLQQLDPKTASSLETPLSDEELKKRSEELNK
ncbi:Uncharacterized protein MSYG_3928 [Malassezia sympodialis ATCC 42132]|uniref:Uncharacterized protein n=1 Tax=Malassezia sympodialis (strain ATCC 42132) TaxID=1230383 RepID=A0A1M8AAW5_MALS4|nr:Uncharacterized protein MSYG_3928 [Malassezia sympodialis ATCC 42132]